ncbi:MAG: helix-turn-helix domain-containing protein [Alphaproteobacteria bacterium]|nr:helix-turn-helix domain-containing protein [Alphaproteobacteria bacterium]MBU2379294.1 helix-turn-helix domain-containing protein [Alphaproteobacteria bacterium]
MGSVLGFPGIDPLDAAIGARLKRWREERGLDVEAVAAVLKITPEEERRAEAGRAHLTSLQIAAATNRLSLPVWALVSDSPAY